MVVVKVLRREADAARKRPDEVLDELVRLLRANTNGTILRSRPFRTIELQGFPEVELEVVRLRDDFFPGAFYALSAIAASRVLDGGSQ